MIVPVRERRDDVTPASWRAAALAALGGGFAVGWLATRPGVARWSVAGAMAVVAGYVMPIAAASRRPPIRAQDEPAAWPEWASVQREPAAREARNDGSAAHTGTGAEVSAGIGAGIGAGAAFAQDGNAGELSGQEAARPDASQADAVTFSVIVAARDEAAVIQHIVRDVAHQDHRTGDGRPLFELVIVDDRSEDGTGRAARLAALEAGIGGVTRIVRRSGEHMPDGKGAALTAIQPQECRGDVVVVLDADARIGPAFLRTLARYVSAGAPAVTARRRVLDAAVTTLAGAQADEQTLDGELQRGRWALGGCSEFRGNGIVVRRSLLSSVGGWRAEALTEDLDLSSRIAAAGGVRVAWALDAEVWEQPVRTWGGLWRQRVRWAEGSIRRTLEHGRRVVTSPMLPLGTRLDFIAYAGQLAVPPVVVGALAAGVFRRRPWPGLALLGAYGASSWILGFDSLRWETDERGSGLEIGERVARATRTTLFGAFWIAVVPVAMWRLATRRGRIEYDKMPHLAPQPAFGDSVATVPDPAVAGMDVTTAVVAVSGSTAAAREPLPASASWPASAPLPAAAASPSTIAREARPEVRS